MNNKTCPTCGNRKSNSYAKECILCSSKGRRKPISERFFKFVNKTSTCWIWTGAKDIAGYGRINSNNISKPAHRVSWEIHNGEIPKGMSVCHKCDNPPCVRYSHLFISTQYGNSLDCTIKGRNNNVRKLTVPQVIEIKSLHKYADKYENGRVKQGFGATALAKKFNVTKNAIQCILSGETWKHLI